MKKIILASNSPRRSQLLKKAGLSFDTISPKFEEEKKSEFDIDNLIKTSKCKALSVKDYFENALIICADTVVILKNECENLHTEMILFKPQNFNEAFSMLKKLSSKTHKVATAITIFDTKTQKYLSKVDFTFVKFRELNVGEIKKYIEDFKPFDKAGSYGIQDFLAENELKNPPKTSFIEKIEGEYENVMGISTKSVIKMLQNFQNDV